MKPKKKRRPDFELVPAMFAGSLPCASRPESSKPNAPAHDPAKWIEAGTRRALCDACKQQLETSRQEAF